MALISIEEVVAQQADEFQAVVRFDHGPMYPCTVRNPFTPAEEEEVEWYFEEHLRFPFVKGERAKAAAASITTYGESLFEQVFADRRTYSTYKACLQAGVQQIQIEIAGSPAWQGLHWEALKDPDLPQPLSLEATMVRKNLTPSALTSSMRESPTLNLLLVTARPSGKLDVGYRTISRPLVELLRQVKLPVRIDILRPGTYEALDKHLQATTQEHGPGYYHMIHFDLHGALFTFAEFQQGAQSERFLYQNRYARADITSYEGEKAFLFFEQIREEKADPVEASELAHLLLTHQVPVAILNACQSGKQVGATETSLGSRLMQAGIQVVLAMGYSVTVSAAELLMRTLYKELFAKRDLSTAIRLARRELANRKTRRVYYNQTLDLEDWLLPVVYQNQPIHLQTRPLTAEESKHFYEGQTNRYKPVLPDGDFEGRDLDILQIEKRVLTRRNILLIRGMGGAGKTALLQHLAFWWQTTGFVKEVFYFGYDERNRNRQQILRALAKQLFSSVEFSTTFQPLSPDAQQTLLAERLCAERHLLILDNLESITGTHLAIGHTLSKKEQGALQRFLKALVGGQSIVLLGSRSGESWLAAETFAENVYELSGLDDEAASALTERILERHGVTKYQKDPHLPALLKILAGFPLALKVVLANLVRQTPEEVLHALQTGDAQLNTGNSEKKTENILRCIEYSHSNLSSEAQSLLTCLAPFTSIFFTDLLDTYSQHLKAQPLLADLPFERWQEVLQEATNQGLLAPDPNIPQFLRLQPTLPYFLRTRLYTDEQIEKQQAIEHAFLACYDEHSVEMYQLLKSKEPQARQLGLLFVGYEYENLRFAMSCALSHSISLVAPYSVLSVYFKLKQDPEHGLQVARDIYQQLTTLTPDSLPEPTKKQIVVVLNDLGRWEAEVGHYKEAEQYFRHALQLFIEFQDRNSQAYTYNNLGLVAQTQRLFPQAEQYFQRSLQLKIEVGDRQSQAHTYHNLGRVVEGQRLFPQAEQYYKNALQLFIEFQDRHAQARTYDQLGIISQEQRLFPQAEKYHKHALQIFIEFGDRYEQSTTYHNLGILARKQRLFPQAEQYFQRSLQLKIEVGDRQSQAHTYSNLGMIAREQRQFPQAVQYHEHALQIYIDFQDRHSQASTYYQLGMIAQEQRLFPQAEQYFQHALQLFIEFGDRYEQPGTYYRLGMIAQEQRLFPQAEQYFQQALEIFVEYGDSRSAVIVLASVARVWNTTQDTNILPAIAAILGDSQEEVEGLFRRLLKGTDETEGNAQ